jgi:hypothetical protein
MLMKLGLEWGLDKMMMTLVEPSIHNFDKKKKVMIWRMWSSSLIYGGLTLFPKEIRVIPPPWIISLRVWPT